MRRVLIGGLLWCLSASLVGAQVIDKGSITANTSGAACAVALSCASIAVPNTGVVSVAIGVSNTYSGTLAFEGTTDGTTWVSVQATNLADGTVATGTTSVGNWSVNNAGLVGVRVRATAFASGQADVSFTRGYAIAKVFRPLFGAVSIQQGTLTADAQALSMAATWNNAAVNFTGIKFTIVDTASGASSFPFRIDGGAAGTTVLFTVDKSGGGVFGSTVSAGQGNSLRWTGRTVMQAPADGAMTINNSAVNSGIRLQVAGAPSCTSNCGTTPSVVGTDVAMTVTMGATGSPASGWVVTFQGTWPSNPMCHVTMAKAGMVIGKLPLTVVTTTTTITVVTNGTAPANGDVYNVSCLGNRS